MIRGITIGFGLLALGPFVHVAGVNTYLPTPWTLLRYVPLIGEARDRLSEMGLPLLAPAEVADALVTVVRGGGTGEAWTCLPQRPPEPLTFRAPEIWAPAPAPEP